MSKSALFAPLPLAGTPIWRQSMIRKRLSAVLLLTMGALFLAVSIAGAVPSPDRPKILLHVRSVPTVGPCTSAFTPTTCSEIVTKAASGTANAPAYHYVYLVVAKGDSLPDVAGVQCGVDYENGALPSTSPEADMIGLDVYSFTLCATMQFEQPGPPSFLQPGGGNLITWDWKTVCQRGELAVAGYWYVGSYGPDLFTVIDRPVDNAAKVATCSADEVPIMPSELGTVTFSPGGTTAGCNPCLDYCDRGDATPPYAPGTPTVAPDCGRIALSWPAVYGADFYVVYRSGAFLATAYGTSYTDLNPGPSKRYYQVAARTIRVQGALSPQAWGKTMAIPKPTQITPEAGSEGMTVAITGTDFGAYDSSYCRIFFTDGLGHDLRATLFEPYWTDTTILCVVPSGAVTGSVRMVNKCGEAQISGGWTPVRILDLAAHETGGTVEITWSVPEDAGPVAFQVDRSMQSAEPVRLTAQPLAGRTAFRFVDTTLRDPGTYTYMLWEVDRQGNASLASRIQVEYRGVIERSRIVVVQPNPASAGVEVTFQVAAPGPMTVEAFDIQGRRVRVIDDQPQERGSHRVVWDCRDSYGRRCPAGAYVIRLTGPGVLSSRKVLVSR